MIKLKLYNKLWIQIETENREYLLAVKNYFSDFVDGYFHMPKYKAGVWDGKIYIFDWFNKCLPYGLLTDLISFHKKYFSNLKLEISDDIKNLFNSKISNIEPEQCKLWNLREYQDESVRKAIKYKKGILRICTSGGKTLIIYSIISTLQKLNEISNSIIIVPSTGLIMQFKQDMIDYGMDEKNIGVAYSKKKEWDKKVVISTWQTLAKNKDQLNLYDCVVVDECHSSKAKILSDILQKSNAKYRIGCTGTLPESQIDLWNIKSYLGPQLIDIPASKLIEENFISSIEVMMYNLYYKKEFIYNGITDVSVTVKYNDIKNQIFNNEYRKQFIFNLINNAKSTILVLVGKVETEGDIIKNYLLESNLYNEDSVIFINGKMDATERENWRQKFIKNPDKKYIIIATYGVFQAGVSIPNLSYLIFAAPFASKIRILQSIGRCLRKCVGKNGAIIYDLVDFNNKYCPKYADTRLRFYDQEKFPVTEKDFKEK